MGLFDKLFGDPDENVVSSRDLKIALMGVRRERRKKQMEMKRLGMKKNETFGRIKKARREGMVEEVDFLYQELQQVKIDTAYCRREAKVLNLEGIGLQRYLRGLERLEKTSNRGRIRDLMERVRTAGLDEKLRGSTVDEEAYLDDLNMTLEDINIELEDVSILEEGDPEKDQFLSQIDKIIALEEGGKDDIAVEEEEQLKDRLEQEDPEF
ncbi:MAG: hypothetical protein P1V97_19295 [Planctomycetota bacterium]|nr:hypothetical protein [Planctomycetota bacterium]